MSVAGVSLRRPRFGLRTMVMVKVAATAPNNQRTCAVSVIMAAVISCGSTPETEDFVFRIDLWVVGWWVESSCKTWHFLSAPAVMVFRSCKVNIDAVRAIVLQGATLQWWLPWYIEGTSPPGNSAILSTLIKLIEGITRKKAEQERELDSRIRRKCYRGNIYICIDTPSGAITYGWKSGEEIYGPQIVWFHMCFMTNVEVITSFSYYLSGALTSLLRTANRWAQALCLSAIGPGFEYRMTSYIFHVTAIL
jgi:hypothetical protein